MMNVPGAPHTGESNSGELPPDNEMFPRPFRGGSVLFVSGLGDIGQGLAAPIDLRTYGDLKNFLAQVYGAFGKSLEQEWPRIVAAIQAEQGRSSMTRLVPGDTSGTIQKHIQVLRDSASHVTSVISDTEALPPPPMPGISGHVEINCGSFSQLVVIPPNVRSFGELREYLLTITPLEIHAELVGDWQNLASSIRDRLSGGRTIDPLLRDALEARARQPEKVFVGSEIAAPFTPTTAIENPDETIMHSGPEVAQMLNRILEEEVFLCLPVKNLQWRNISAAYINNLRLLLASMASREQISQKVVRDMSLSPLDYGLIRNTTFSDIESRTSVLLALDRLGAIAEHRRGVEVFGERAVTYRMALLEAFKRTKFISCHSVIEHQTYPDIFTLPQDDNEVRTWLDADRYYQAWQARIETWLLKNPSSAQTIREDLQERKKVYFEMLKLSGAINEPCPEELRFRPTRTCESVLLPTQIAPDDLSNLIEVADGIIYQSILPNYGSAALPAAAQAVMALVDGRVKTAKDTLRGRPITSWPQLQELLSAYQVQDSDIANLDAAWQEVFRSMRSSTNALQMKILQVAAKAFHLQGTPAEVMSTSLSKPTAIVPAQLAAQFGRSLEILLRQDAKAQQNTALLDTNIRSFTFKAMKIFEGSDPVLTDFAADVWKKRLVQLACEVFSTQVAPDSIKKYCSDVNAVIEMKIRNGYELKHQEPIVLGHPLSPNEITELWNAEDGVEGPEWRMKTVIDNSKGIYPHTKLRTKEEVLAVVQPYNPEKWDEFWYRLCVAADAQHQNRLATLPTSIGGVEFCRLWDQARSLYDYPADPAYGPNDVRIKYQDTYPKDMIAKVLPNRSQTITKFPILQGKLALLQFMDLHTVREKISNPSEFHEAVDTLRVNNYAVHQLLVGISQKSRLIDCPNTEYLPVAELPKLHMLRLSELEHQIRKHWKLKTGLAKVLAKHPAGNSWGIYTKEAWDSIYAYFTNRANQLTAAELAEFMRVWPIVQQKVLQDFEFSPESGLRSTDVVLEEVTGLPRERITVLDAEIFDTLELICAQSYSSTQFAAIKLRLKDRKVILTKWDEIRETLSETESELLKEWDGLLESNIEGVPAGTFEREREYIRWRVRLTESVLVEVGNFEGTPPTVLHYTEILANRPRQMMVRPSDLAGRLINTFELNCEANKVLQKQKITPDQVASVKKVIQQICGNDAIYSLNHFHRIITNVRKLKGKNLGLLSICIDQTCDEISKLVSHYDLADQPKATLVAAPEPTHTELSFETEKDYVSELSSSSAELANVVLAGTWGVNKHWQPTGLLSNTKALQSVRMAVPGLETKPAWGTLEKTIRSGLNKLREMANGGLPSPQHVACWLLQALVVPTTFADIADLEPADQERVTAWFTGHIRSLFIPATISVTATESATDDSATDQDSDAESSDAETGTNPETQEVDPLQEAFELCDATDDASKRQLLGASCAGIANQFGIPLIEEYTAAIQHWYSTADVASLTTLAGIQTQMIECRKATTLSHDPNFAAIFDLRVSNIQDPLELLDIGMSWQAEAIPPVPLADEPVPETTTTHRDDTIETPPVADEPQFDTNNEETGETDAEAATTVAEVTDILDELDRADPSVPAPVADSTPGKPRNNESAPVAEIVSAPRLSLSLNQILVASRQTLHRLLRELRVAEEARDAAQGDPAELERLTKRHESVLIALQALLHTLRQ